MRSRSASLVEGKMQITGDLHMDGVSIHSCLIISQGWFIIGQRSRVKGHQHRVQKY